MSASTLQRAPQAPDLPTTPLRFVLHFIAQYRWWYLLMFVLETTQATCGILIPYALGKITQAVVKSGGVPAAQVVEGLQGPMLLFVALSVGEVVFSRTAGTIQFSVGPKQRQSATRALYAWLQHHSHRYFSNNFAGALAHRISETSVGVNQTLWLILFDFWPVAIVLGVAIALLAHAHVGLALFVFGWAVAFVGLSYALAMRAQPYTTRAAAARSDTTGKIVDSVSNITSARLFARLQHERRQLDQALESELEHVQRSVGYSDRVRWFNYIAAAVLKIGLLWYSLHLWGQGAISVGDFVMAVSLSLLVINEARNLSRRFLELFEYIGNVANGVHTILRPHELVDAPQAREARLPDGAIAFEGVHFGYSVDKPIFRDLNVSIPAGQRVGLVGLSGSGKSTFVSLILRLYEPQRGRVRIDGEDIAALTQDAVHSQVGLIPQDPTLFHRSLRENIRYGRLDASDADIELAAQRAHAHDFILQMKEGYDSMVGERGVKLSGGQRQRIAIARVILKDAPVLILDEATSSLDSLTERAIQETLEDVMVGKTVIVVAHRLSTIADLDRILVFDHGRIVEDGSHRELLSRRGAYWKLWSRQAGGFLPEDTDGMPQKPAPAIGDLMPASQAAASEADEDPRQLRPAEEPEPGDAAAVTLRAGR
ncbi:MAG: ABC transporter ATP-binding protein [Aquabacterium sp.]|nr:MAG: ABC transporter ATP-binding protein [Aquabacterium sp.]